MDERERIRILELTLARLLQWIAAAESRIAITLGVDTALLGSMATFAPSPERWGLAAATSGAIAIFCIAGSWVCVWNASIPRIKGPKQSFIFFLGIASRDEAQYIQEAKSLDETKYLDDLARQCHRNAQIARDKFLWVKRAQISLFAAIIPWVISIFFLYQVAKQ